MNKFYSNIQDKNGVTKELVSILDDIKNGTYKAQIENLRDVLNTQGKQAYDKKKIGLPFFVAHNTQSKSKADITETNNFLWFDIDAKDQKENFDLDFVKESIQNWEYTRAVFLSPSGQGLKFCVETQDLVLYNQEEKIENFIPAYKIFIEEILDLFPETFVINSDSTENVKFDTSQGEVQKNVFVSYDPHLYCNPTSEKVAFGKFIGKAIDKIAKEREENKNYADNFEYDIDSNLSEAEHAQKLLNKLLTFKTGRDFLCFRGSCVANRAGISLRVWYNTLVQNLGDLGRHAKKLAWVYDKYKKEHGVYNYKPQVTENQVCETYLPNFVPEIVGVFLEKFGRDFADVEKWTNSIISQGGVHILVLETRSGKSYYAFSNFYNAIKAKFGDKKSIIYASPRHALAVQQFNDATQTHNIKDVALFCEGYLSAKSYNFDTHKTAICTTKQLNQILEANEHRLQDIIIVLDEFESCTTRGAYQNNFNVNPEFLTRCEMVLGMSATVDVIPAQHSYKAKIHKFDRIENPETTINIFECKSDDDVAHTIELQAIKYKNDRGIWFCKTTKEAERTDLMLKNLGINSTCVHAQTANKEDNVVFKNIYENSELLPETHLVTTSLIEIGVNVKNSDFIFEITTEATAGGLGLKMNSTKQKLNRERGEKINFGLIVKKQKSKSKHSVKNFNVDRFEFVKNKVAKTLKDLNEVNNFMIHKLGEDVSIVKKSLFEDVAKELKSMFTSKAKSENDYDTDKFIYYNHAKKMYEINENLIWNTQADKIDNAYSLDDFINIANNGYFGDNTTVLVHNIDLASKNHILEDVKIEMQTTENDILQMFSHEDTVKKLALKIYSESKSESEKSLISNCTYFKNEIDNSEIEGTKDAKILELNEEITISCFEDIEGVLVESEKQIIPKIAYLQHKRLVMKNLKKLIQVKNSFLGIEYSELFEMLELKDKAFRQKVQVMQYHIAKEIFESKLPVENLFAKKIITPYNLILLKRHFKKEQEVINLIQDVVKNYTDVTYEMLADFVNNKLVDVNFTKRSIADFTKTYFTITSNSTTDKKMLISDVELITPQKKFLEKVTWKIEAVKDINNEFELYDKEKFKKQTVENLEIYQSLDDNEKYLYYEYLENRNGKIEIPEPDEVFENVECPF